MKRFKNYQVLYYVIQDMVKEIPFWILGSALYIFIDAAWNIISLNLLTMLFDEIENVFAGYSTKFWCIVCLYIVGYGITQITNICGSIIDNNGIYEKFDLILRNRLVDYLTKCPLLFFEDAENIRKIQQARRCISEEAIPNIWRNFIDFLGAMFALFGILGVLLSYSPFLLVLVFISTVPVLFVKVY